MKASLLINQQIYFVSSGLGGVFSVKYTGRMKSGDNAGMHRFRIINKGWEKTLYYSDAAVEKNIFKQEIDVIHS